MNDTTQGPGGFDPSILIGATMTEANTRRPPIPPGTVLIGTLGEVAFRQVEGKQEKTFGKTFTFARIPVELDLTPNPGLQAQIGQDKVTISYEFGVDLLPNNAGFDMAKGKNNGLRQLRDALGMNVQGQPFNFSMIVGRSVRCMVKNEPGQDGEAYDKVGSVAPVK